MYDYVTTKPPLNDETLAHYGIKGMKRSVRKKDSKPKTLDEVYANMILKKKKK